MPQNAESHLGLCCLLIKGIFLKSETKMINNALLLLKNIDCFCFRSCQIGNNIYRGGEKFSLKQKCTLYKDCTCSCDGQWSCSGENAVDTCNACKKCNVDGTIHDPYSRFNMERGCWLYKCFCNCDGAARCPSLTAVNTCNVPDDCRSCDVRGTSYPGNRHFEFDVSGMTMTCKCNCDGSYVCIAEWINWVEEQIDISGSGIGSGAGRCLTCAMNNRYYQGDSNYVIERAGIQMNCSCYCNGGYYCYGEQTFADESCRGCSLVGRSYDGESSFPLIYQGLKLTCSCSCDGSYFCVGSDQQMLVQCLGGRGPGCLTQRCSQCFVDGIRFDGGDVFSTTYEGVELRCECGCDGSYYCEGSSGLILSCFGGTCRQLGCTSCSVFGETYGSNSNFEIIYKGLKLDCQCDCGNYQCFGSSGTLIVSCIDGGPGCLLSECQQCYVNSRPYQGGSTFSYNYNGIEMLCTCGCDGSYFCAGVTEAIEIACVGGVCTRLGCQPCNLFGRTYEGDSSFDIIYSGVVLGCQCSCDSSYRCVGSTGVTVVCQNNGRGCLPSTCNTCNVNGREYAGRSEFRASYKGIDIQCRCGCDGTSHCTGVTTSIEVSCIRGTCTRIGCGECNIFGTEFLGNSQFDIIYQGMKLTCDCDCDSSYICRGEAGSTVVTCANGRGCLPSTCRPCVVDGNTYVGTSKFAYVYNGFDMACMCGCDGSYFCEGVIEKISISCVGGSCNPVGCTPCRLYNQDFRSLSGFEIIYGGELLTCKCQCDGSYSCLTESGIAIVQCINGRGCLPQLCGSCVLDGRSFAGGSTFRYRYNDYDVNCRCGCDSSVYCTGVSSNVKITCIGGRCNPVGCQSCRVYGKDYAGLSSFDIIYEGLLLNCVCDCLGGYVCQGEGTTTTITCKDARGCLSQRCDTCNFNGRSYRGGGVFKYNYKNIDFSCTCGCDGSVYCQGVGVTTVLRCLDGECIPLGCQNCDVFGRQYSSLSRFDIIYEGVRLNCDCGCLGDYVCVGSTGTTVVQCLAGGRGCLANTCRNCVLGGREYRADSKFRHLYEGIEMDCTCSCDGSSFCTGVTEVIEISCIGDRCSPINCRNCNIFGDDYGSLSSFQLIYKGFRIDCRCSCDGSYICTGSTGDRVVECLADGRGCLPSTCRNCVLNGREYRAGTMFPSKYKDIDMNCNCGCDGSSFCEGITEVISISCIGDTCSPIGCRQCNIFGRNYAGDSQFDIVYRGVKMQCDCKCDSSYRCVGSTGDSQINCREGRRCLPNRCRKCRVNGVRYDGNTRFQSDYQGITMDCTCGCDGSYFCQGTRTDIQLSCPRRGSCTQIGGCRSCSIFGIEFEGNSRKSFVYQGYNMDCECSCDSSYRCVGTKGELTTSCEAGKDCLPPPCRRCTVEGMTYAGNSEFSLNYKGINMRCVCGCDSSYFCQGTQTDIQIACPRRGDCTQIGCRSCSIFGIEFEGGSRKEFVYQGFNMNCECSCDSSYRCIGVKGEVTTQCAANGNCLPPPCRSCRHEGRTYPGNSRFSTVYNGINMDCVCGCDSSYFCRGEDTTTEISCLKGVPCRQVGCRTCLSDGRERLANSEFEKMYDGIRMNCLCNCDGSYRCQGVRVTITISCQGEACSLVGCRSCLYNNQEYKNGASFEKGVGNSRQRCTCECDGSHRCEDIRPACQSCFHDGETHEGDTRYRIYRGRDSFICECKCNGQHRCEPERPRRPTCSSCDIFGRTYEGNQQFKTDIRGFEYDCTCNCNGTWRCISDVFGYSCEGTDCGAKDCRSCTIDGRSFEGDTRFSEICFGERMNCECDCYGRYRCESDTQICTNSGCQSKCRQCEINGRNYPGDSAPFQAYVENRLMTCTCDCSGGYRCESEQWTCTSTSGCVSRCRGCSIEGRNYEGGTEFQADVSGTRMSCSCDCSGRYTCRGGNLICTSGTGCRSTCNKCVIDNVQYDENPRFYANVEGRRMQCSCDCSGSYSCQTDTRICTSRAGCSDRCTECEIDGKRYAGNTRFEIDHSMGIRMSCECRCNGGYTCNGTKETTTCIGSGCSEVGCQDCVVDGVPHPGGSTFEIQRGRVRMQCSCDCNGGYKCRGEERITTCEGPGCPGQCGPCNVDGRTIEGNTRFTHEKDGVDLECICKCDGGYSCEGTKVCSGSGCRTTGCKRCTIDRRHYTGNTRFRVALNNVDYDCTCFCDGSYSCTSSTGIVQSCVGSSCAADECRNCILDGKEYELDSRFRLTKNRLLMNCICECDGAYRCFSISGTCVGPECDEYGCKSCLIDGKTYKGNAEHRISRGGRDLVCTCECSGHYTCRYPTLQVECKGADCGIGGCQQCNVDGKRYAGNSRFQMTKYGLFMECACNCDSSYTCRGYQIISTGQGPVEDTCKTCEIDGRTYNGNTRFQAMINGVRSVCSCDCNGRYSCQGAKPTCRSCNIGDESYPGNNDFVLTRDGYSVQCRCDCNGDFVCVGRQDDRGVIGGCRDCIIFGTRYKGDTSFTTDARGIRMLCDCHCNGGYSCKGYRTVTSVTLPSEKETTCASCYDGSTRIEGNTEFQIQRGCFLIDCACRCDGSWECPYQVPKFTCYGETSFDSRETYVQERYSIAGSHVYTSGPVAGDSRTVITSVDTSSGVRTCQNCNVNNQEITGNAEFTLREGCLRFSCLCNCNGGWNCTSVEGSDCGVADGSNTGSSIVNTGTSREWFAQPRTGSTGTTGQDCQPCDAFGKLQPPNEKFAGQDECYLYSCFCNCDGSWNCPSELTVKTCADTSDIYNPAAGTCRQCILGQDKYDYRETFELVRDCIRYRCTCDCDGSYMCPSAQATRICRTGSGAPGRIPNYSSRIDRGSSGGTSTSSRTRVSTDSGSDTGGSGRTEVRIRTPGGSSGTSSTSSTSTRVTSTSTRRTSSRTTSGTSSSSSRRTGGSSTSRGGSSVSTSSRRTGGSSASRGGSVSTSVSGTRSGT